MRHASCFLSSKSGELRMKGFQSKNTGAVQMASNPLAPLNSKLNYIHQRFLRGLVLNGDVTTTHTSFEDQHAAFLPKPFTRNSF